MLPWMKGLNKVTLIGYLGKDPDVRYLDNGTVYANVSLATSEIYTDKTTGQKQSVTDWHNIVLWRGLAEVAKKYLHKGSPVYVEGKLKTRSWEDQNNIRRFTTEIIARDLILLGSNSANSQNQASTYANNSPKETTTPTVDTAEEPPANNDLPF